MRLLRNIFLLLFTNFVSGGRYYNRYAPVPNHQRHKSSQLVQYPRCHKSKTLLEVIVLDTSGSLVENAEIIKADDKTFFKKANPTERFETDNSGIAKFYAVGCEATLIISKDLYRKHHQVNLKDCKTLRKREIVVLDPTNHEIQNRLGMIEREISGLLDTSGQCVSSTEFRERFGELEQEISGLRDSSADIQQSQRRLKRILKNNNNLFEEIKNDIQQSHSLLKRDLKKNKNLLKEIKNSLVP